MLAFILCCDVIGGCTLVERNDMKLLKTRSVGYLQQQCHDYWEEALPLGSFLSNVVFSALSTTSQVPSTYIILEKAEITTADISRTQ